MSDNYYKLLGLQRDEPHWMFSPKVWEVAEKAAGLYGSVDDIPDILKLALSTLQNEDMRDQYDSFLEWAEEGTELNPDHLGADTLHLATEAHHFAVDHLPNGKLKLLLQQVRTPPSPPPPGTVKREEPQQQEQQTQTSPRQAASTPRQTPARDAVGRINGHPPPLQLGNKTFTYDFGWLRLVHAQVVTEKRPFKRTFVKAQWQHKESGRTFAENNYCGWNTSRDFWQPGQNYHALWLKETVSEEFFLCCYAYENPQGTMLSITHPFQGLFRMFYHEIEHRRFEQLYPGYQLVYDYFGTGGITTDESMEIAVRYLRETGYWVIQSMFGMYVPEEARNLANLATKDSIRAWNYPPRKLRKLGVPV